MTIKTKSPTTGNKEVMLYYSLCPICAAEKKVKTHEETKLALCEECRQKEEDANEQL